MLLIIEIPESSANEEGGRSTPHILQNTRKESRIMILIHPQKTIIISIKSYDTHETSRPCHAKHISFCSNYL